MLFLRLLPGCSPPSTPLCVSGGLRNGCGNKVYVLARWTPHGDYTIVINATSGTTAQNMALELTIQCPNSSTSWSLDERIALLAATVIVVSETQLASQLRTKDHYQESRSLEPPEDLVMNGDPLIATERSTEEQF